LCPLFLFIPYGDKNIKRGTKIIIGGTKNKKEGQKIKIGDKK